MSYLCPLTGVRVLLLRQWRSWRYHHTAPKASWPATRRNVNWSQMMVQTPSPGLHQNLNDIKDIKNKSINQANKDEALNSFMSSVNLWNLLDIHPRGLQRSPLVVCWCDHWSRTGCHYHQERRQIQAEAQWDPARWICSDMGPGWLFQPSASLPAGRLSRV